MAANVSPGYIKKSLAALVKLYNNLDERLVNLVAHQYAFDFKKAEKALAEIEGQRVNSAKIPKTNQGNNNVPGNYVGPSDLYDSIVHIIKAGYKVLVLMRGLPGSGKTTLAMQILYRSLGAVNKETFILSPDEYVFSPGSNIYNINKINKIDEPHEWNQKRCFTNMRKGVSPIIIDDVNLEIEDMKVYCVMAVQFGYVIQIAVPLTRWALNPRMLTIKNNHGVNEMKIKEMYKCFQENITAENLHDKFKLQYIERMPQLRKYPPLQRTLQPMEQIGVAAGKSTGQQPPQREYGSLAKKKLIDIENETKSKCPSIDGHSLYIRPSTFQSNLRNSSSKNFDHAPVSKFTSSALNNPTVTSPNKDVNIQEIDEEATKRKQQEMAPKNIEKQEDLKLTHDDNLDWRMIVDLIMLPEQHHSHQWHSDYQKLLTVIVSIHSLSNENENFIKKLEKEKRKSDSENNNANVDLEEWKNITLDVLALKLARQKLYAALPHIEPKVLDDTSSIIENPCEPPISDMVLNEMRKQYLLVNEVRNKSQNAVKSVASCKSEASRHAQNWIELLELAEQQQRLRNYEVAIFYVHLIEVEHEKAVAAINDAVYLFLLEYATKSVRLFLHFLTPEHAVYVLNAFIDRHIINLIIANKDYDYYFVTTDIGTANKGRLSSKRELVIKKRLEDKKIPFESIDSDTLRIKVQKTSITTLQEISSRF